MYVLKLYVHMYAVIKLHIYYNLEPIVSKEEFQNYNHVGKAFIVLQTKMRTLLKKANCGDLRRACIAQMHNPDGAELTPNVVEKISLTQNIDDLFDLLVRTPYWSWIDIRILEMMVTASGNSLAVKLLDNYKAAIFSKRLIDLLPNVFGKEIDKERYTKLTSKIRKDPKEMTVSDLLELQSKLEIDVMNIKKGICILEYLEKGCVEIHWYIPTSCVDGAYQTARVKRYQFSDLHLQYLQIGDYPVIHDPLASPDVMIAAPSPPVNVGKLCNIILFAYVLLFCPIATVKDFIDCYYDYLSVNMDAEVVSQLMVFQQLLSEDIVMAASSDHHKNTLILQQVRLMNVQSLVSFGELLLTNDSQKHIGTMFVDGKCT